MAISRFVSEVVDCFSAVEVVVVEKRAASSWPRLGPGLGLGVWKSGDLEIQKFPQTVLALKGSWRMK